MFPQHFGSYDVLRELGRNATIYLGIGVQEGECVRHATVHNNELTLVLCDPWGPHHGGTGRGNHDHVEEKLINSGHLGKRHYLDGLSQELIPSLPHHTKFDLIYVDGDHSEEAALTDLRNCWPRLLQDGYMVVHDIKMPPVWSALLRFMDSLPAVEAEGFFCVEGHGTAILKKIG